MAIPLRRRQSVMTFSIKLKELVFCDYHEIISVDVQVMGVVKPVFLERLFRQNPNGFILRYIQFAQSAVASYETRKALSSIWWC